VTGPTLRSDIPEERDQARVEAVLAYRERVTWKRCGACGEWEAWDPLISEFVWPCSNKPKAAGSTPTGATNV